MEKMKILKNTLAILFVLTIIINSINIPKTMAYTDLFIQETSDRPNIIEGSVRLNPETKRVADYAGKDAYCTGDEIKLDVYIETPYINLNTLSVGVGLSTNAFEFVGYELGEEIPEEYKNKFSKRTTYNQFIDYSSGKADYSPDGVILEYEDSTNRINNSGEFKVFTATFKVKKAFMDLKTFKDYIKNVKPCTTYSNYRNDENRQTCFPRMQFNSIYDFYVMSEPNQVLIYDTTAKMKINEYKKFSVKVNPETAYQGVKWSSNNPDVVSVSDDGVVIAKKEGKATITAKATAKESVKCNYNITVNGLSDNVLIEKITIDNKEKINNLYPGKYANVLATILPENTNQDKTITYSSSNPEVATIDSDGTIRAIYPGTTKITVKTTNAKTDEYTITVKNPVSKVKIKNKTAGIYLYDYMGYPLDIETEPEGYEELVKLSSSNENEVIVDNTYKSIRALDVGDVKITAQVGDVKDSFMVGAFTKEMPATSVKINNKIEEMELKEEIQLDVTIEPNPETNPVSKLAFKVDDTSIADISTFGILKAKKGGKVKVTAYSATTEDSFIVNINAESGIEDFEIIDFNGKVEEYASSCYAVKITPENADGKNFWEASSSNLDILDAYKWNDDEIVIDGISPGEADIIITAGSDYKKIIHVKVFEYGSQDNYLKGDVNGNGIVELTDYSMILKHVKGIKLLEGEQKERADVNGNGTIELTDYSMVLKHVKGIKLLN